MKWGLIVIAILILVVLYIIIVNNKLVRLRNAVKEAFSSIDVQLKKRYDLIPNFVETVKQYMEHEKSTLDKIVELRNRATSGNVSTEERIKIENELSSSLRGIMVQVEAYPDLKANEGFSNLQNTLNSVETSIASARTYYNSAVLNYNNECMVFPANIIAGMFGFKQEAMFEAPEEERKNVDVKNLFNN